MVEGLATVAKRAQDNVYAIAQTGMVDDLARDLGIGFVELDRVEVPRSGQLTRHPYGAVSDIAAELEDSLGLTPL